MIPSEALLLKHVIKRLATGHRPATGRLRPRKLRAAGAKAAGSLPRDSGIPSLLETSLRITGIGNYSIKLPGTQSGSQSCCQGPSYTVLRKMPSLLEHDLCSMCIVPDGAHLQNAGAASRLAKEGLSGTGPFHPRSPLTSDLEREKQGKILQLWVPPAARQALLSSKKWEMLNLLTAGTFLHQIATRGGAILGPVLVRKRNVKITLDGAINAIRAEGEAEPH